MTTYDTIIIGAGAMGSAAAYHLSKARTKVLLLEQFALDHRWGSSYGHSRIIRYSYHQVDYIALAGPNYQIWSEVEAEAGEQLLITTGGIDFGHADDESLSDTLHSMQAMNIPHEVMNASEANKRFTQFHFTDHMKVVYQAESGMLRASKAVKAHVRLAQQHGAMFHSNEPVKSIDVHADSVTLKTANATYSAARLILTAGAWAQRLLEQTGLSLPFETLRCQLCFFQPHEQPDSYDVSHMPIFIYHRATSIRGTMYGLPSFEGTGVKAAFNGGEPKGHPENVDYEPDNETTQRVRDTIGDHLPIARHGALLSTRICLYTQTPDAHFVIDKHPQHNHVIIGGGFSGHGFKFSTLIGKILGELALAGQTQHNISRFRVDRFS